MDPELGKKTCDIELPQQQPKKKSKKVCVIVSCFIGLVLLSLVELFVLPLRSFGADDAHIKIFFDGRDVIDHETARKIGFEVWAVGKSTFNAGANK